MSRSMVRIPQLVALLIVLCPCVAFPADLPTADEILQIHRDNRQRLSKLHLQLVHVYETTEADCKSAQRQADEKDKFLKLLSQQKSEDVVFEVDGKQIRGAEAQRLLEQLTGNEERKQIRALRLRVKPFRIIHPMEFFLNGEEYQFRQPVRSLNTEEQRKAWTFADAPLTAETLPTVYRDVSVFSRSARSKPAARWWHMSADSHAYITQKHLTDVMVVRLPPFTDVIPYHWDRSHPFDAFFTQPAEKYRVVREDEIDGRLLTVVDVAVSIHPQSPNQIFYRAWLDLKRGAVPAKVHHAQGVGKMPEGFFDRVPPAEITTTRAVRELPQGGFYPAATVTEEWGVDPDAPELTPAEQVEVRDGKRKTPMVVHRRHTWDCSVVEIPPRFDDDFFIVRFPEGQALFDHDAGRMIGALETKPLVQVGQQAPQLTIARWLDGKQRTLDDLRGRVVVLDFWGLWCGACRSSVPRLKAIQDRFQNQPVTFISIHTAEKDPQALAVRIEEFAHSQDWKYLGAIDAGRMLEDSVTTNEYGITGFPTMVIVGPDGRIAYVDPQLDGPLCDNEDPVALAEFEKKLNNLMQARFKSVGETWPIPAQLDEKEREAIHRRVEVLFIAQQIESALKAKR
jgi:thiol-disulfide isomerase/thioredoxin